MKVSIKIISSCALIALLSACDQANNTTNPSATDTSASAISTISLIHMNDLHAHLTPHNEYEYRNGTPIIKKNGGLARIASAIKQLRSKNPNTILMNIGDTYHGGVEALYTNGNAIVDPVNALNIDIGVPGNWDFAYGPGVTRLRYTGQGLNPSGGEVKQVNYPSLAANVSSTTQLAFLPATQTITVNNITLGFIGITSDIVPRMSGALAIGFDFLQGKQNYIDLINSASQQLRDNGVDAVIVMSELGIHKDIALANSINNNSVDVFFSAHTHELTTEPLQSSSGALIVEAGNDTYLGHMDLHFDTNNQLTATNWQVLVIDERYADDSYMSSLVNAARAPFLDANVNMTFPISQVSQTLTQPINTVIATANQPLNRRQALENIFNSAFTGALKQYAGTDIALTPGFRFDSVIAEAGYLFEDNSIASGDISIEDAYRFFPVALNLASGNISGARLKSIIEENLEAVFSTDTFKHSGGWFDGFAGLDITLDLSKPENQRIIDIQLSNSQQSILDSDSFTIAGCARPLEANADSTLCGYSGFSNVSALINPTSQAPWTAIDFLINRLQNAQLISTQPARITDINNTLMWPGSDYIQPLKGAK